MVKDAIKQFDRDYGEKVEDLGYLLNIGINCPIEILDEFGFPLVRKFGISALVSSEFWIPEAIDMKTKGIFPDYYYYESMRIPVTYESISMPELA